MTLASSAAQLRRSPVLADRLLAGIRPATHPLLRDTALVAVGVAFVTLSAQVQVPLWPVPVTGQTLAVMLVGAALGARRGMVSLTAYLVLTLAGLPLLTGWQGGLTQLHNPAFGYVIGFIASAGLIGWLSEHRWDRKPLLSLLGFGLASAAPFVFGLPWLAMTLAGLGAPHSLGAVLASGLLPFVAGGLVKWAIAAAALPLAHRALSALSRR